SPRPPTPTPHSPLPAAAHAGVGTRRALSTEEILKRRPFAPTNVDRLGPTFYPQAPFVDWATPAQALPEDEARRRLQETLTARAPAEPAKVQAALDLVDSQRMLRIVKDAALRLALVALWGTVAEPAIDSLLAPAQQVTTIRFGQ